MNYTIILRRRDPARWLRFVPMISAAAASIDSGNESCPLSGFDECRRDCRLAPVFCVVVLVDTAVSPADSSDASSLTADSVFRFRLVITLLGNSGKPSKLDCSSPTAVSVVVDGAVEFSFELDDDDDDLLLDLGLDTSLLLLMSI